MWEEAVVCYMRSKRFICAVGVSLWSVLVVGQSATPMRLSETVRARVRDGRFGLVTSIRGLPLGVRDGLQALFGNQGLDIAEPGAEFQGTDGGSGVKLPSRRLVAAGCTMEYCLVYYERGGPTREWRVALFHWTPTLTRFEGGGFAPGGLATIDDVRTALLSGAITDPSSVW